MPKLLHARPPLDETERRLVRKLATSRHAPADWVWHAKMIARSWDGARTSTIAAELGCHPQTVRERLQAFNERGVDGLGIKPGGGRRPRLTEAERSAIIALARSTPPGKLVPERDSGELLARMRRGWREWTLDTLTEAARAQGIQVARSQVRRILLARRRALATHAAVGDERRSGVCPKRTRIVALYTDATGGSDDPLCRRARAGNATDLPTGSWAGRRMATASKPHSSTAAATIKPGSTERCASGMDRSAPRPLLHATPLAYLEVLGAHRSRQSRGRPLSHHGQSLQPHQRPHP